MNDDTRHIPGTDPGSAIENERRHLAARLDRQIITPVNLLLSQINAYEQTFNDPTMQMVLSVLNTLTRQVLMQTLDLQAELHPAVLESLGLEPALETLVRQTQRSSGLDITLKLERLEQRPPLPIELALFRAAQTYLNDAVEQQRAAHLTLQLATQDKGLMLTIQYAGLEEPTSLIGGIQQLGGAISYSLDTVHINVRLAPPVELTGREREVLFLLTEGLTNKDIAGRLQVSARTVNFHLDNIYSKLGVNTRTEAAIYALRTLFK